MAAIIARLMGLSVIGRMVLLLNIYLFCHFLAGALQHLALPLIAMSLLCSRSTSSKDCCRLQNTAAATGQQKHGTLEQQADDYNQASHHASTAPESRSQPQEDTAAATEESPNHFTFMGRTHQVRSVVSTIIFSEHESDTDFSQGGTDSELATGQHSEMSSEQDTKPAGQEVLILGQKDSPAISDDEDDYESDESELDWHDDDADAEISSEASSTREPDGRHTLNRNNILLLRKREHKRAPDYVPDKRNLADEFADINAMIQLLTKEAKNTHSIDAFLFKNRSSWMRIDRDGRNCMMKGLEHIFWDRHGMNTDNMEDFGTAHRNSVKLFDGRYKPLLSTERAEWNLNMYSSTYRSFFLGRNKATDTLQVDDEANYPLERVPGFRKLATGKLGYEEVTVRADLSNRNGISARLEDMIEWSCPEAEDSYQDLLRASLEPVAHCIEEEHFPDKRTWAYKTHLPQVGEGPSHESLTEDGECDIISDLQSLDALQDETPPNCVAGKLVERVNIDSAYSSGGRNTPECHDV